MADPGYYGRFGGAYIPEIYGVAKALLRLPDVLLIDAVASVLEAPDEFKPEILSTHDPDHAFAVGSRVALLHRGGIRAAGTPAEALTSAALSEVYGVFVRVECLTGGRTVCLPSLTRQGESQRTDPVSRTS